MTFGFIIRSAANDTVPVFGYGSNKAAKTIINDWAATTIKK